MKTNDFIQKQKDGYKALRNELKKYHNGEISLEDIQTILRQSVAEMPNFYYNVDEDVLEKSNDIFLAEFQEELNREIDNFANLAEYRTSCDSSGSILFAIYQDDAVFI